MDLLKCPNCSSDMEKVKDEDITIDRCKKCEGIFLDKGELNILATGMAGDIEFSSIDEKKHKDKFRIRNCPKCAEKMRKINLLAYSDTIFDFCPKCESFFLDKGELRKMNLELEELTKDKNPEEYRNHIEDHLVRLDKINDVGVGGVGPAAYPQNIFFLKLSIYFKEPLDMGLRIYSEKWTHKISKLIGLSKEQDIQVGFDDLDHAFIIQGKDKQKVTALLSSKEVREGLLDFVSNKPQMLTTPSRLEIIDRRIILTEGAYTGSENYDIEKDANGVVKRTLKLAQLIEKHKVA